MNKGAGLTRVMTIGFDNAVMILELWTLDHLFARNVLVKDIAWNLLSLWVELSWILCIVMNFHILDSSVHAKFRSVIGFDLFLVDEGLKAKGF